MLTNKEIKSAPGFNRTTEERAKHNIHNAANWIIGGYENAMSDYSEHTEEYQSAKEALLDTEELKLEIYQAATSEIYEEGFCGWSGDASKILKDIRFLGKEKLMQMIEAEIVNQNIAV